ncbi:AAA-like domain-containing protein [Polyangium jinanense]|uniref:AAA-like domain-containing protein n=1 Tax=Polyangium jinanense TaxID=2829994 RepID=A0A9X3XF80_9BACT|nr:AAA-like domain-containing protein [Polyangium jinanense]MDC3958830.1 AAA-like domain-containing protein [Polyangium jinanense]MDC3989192.1 AAA-like domain-containing protein [Polyangium jinanense]
MGRDKARGARFLGTHRHRRRFNVVGPCHDELHYMLAASTRLAEVPDLVARGSYVVVHAPRMHGRTTWLRGLSVGLAESGAWAVVRASCRPRRGAEASGERALLEAIAQAAAEQLPAPLRPPPWPPSYDVRFAGVVLSAWARACPRPLILLLDDVELLPREIRASLLAQLRATYEARPRAAPWSVVLSGSDEVQASAVELLGPAATSLRLPDFTATQVAALCAEHTEETGQPFRDEAVAQIAAISGGHPWVVNVLAREIVEKLRPPLRQPITAAHVMAAAERLRGAWI